MNEISIKLHELILNSHEVNTALVISCKVSISTINCDTQKSTQVVMPTLCLN